MSFVYSGYFRENLDRINSTGQSSRNISANRELQDAQKSFNEVLGDLDRRTENVKESEALAAEEGVTEELPFRPTILTNMKPREQNVAEVTLDPPVNRLTNASKIQFEIQQAIVSKTPETGVNGPAPAVNNLPPTSPFIFGAYYKTSQTGLVGLANHAPSSPDIKSARWLLDTSRAAEKPHSGTYSRKELTSIITAAGKKHGIDPYLGLAVGYAESSLRHNAVSKDGHNTKGIFQLKDQTGKELLSQLKLDEKYDPFDPELNSFLGIGYLRRLHEVFSNETVLTNGYKTEPAKSSEQLEKLAVAAFNAGEGTVAKAQAQAKRRGRDAANFNEIAEYLPAGTRSYVSRVTQLRRALEDLA